MKITYGISVYWPAINGASIYAHRLARAMAEEHEVRVITQSREHDHDWLYSPTLDSKGSFVYEDGKAKVNLIGVRGFEKMLLWPAVNLYYSLNHFSTAVLQSVFRRKVFPLVRGADLVHNYLLDLDYFNCLLQNASQSEKIPYIVTPFIHSSLMEDKLNTRRMALIRNADRVIALTHQEKDWLIREGVTPAKVYVIPGGPVLSSQYHAETFRKKYHIEGPMVLFIATKRKCKGYQHILEAMGRVWSQHPDTHFVFLGMRTQEFENDSRHFQDKRVIDIGLTDLEEKTSALAACDLFCMPSVAESFGIVFTEAWSLHKPVIGGDCPSTREIIDHGKDGFIVSQDSNEIAKQINLLLSDGSLCEQMGRLGKQKVQNQYSWEKAVEKLKGIYSELLN